MNKQQISDEQATELIRDGQGRRWMQERYAIGTGRFERLKTAMARQGWSPEHDMTHTVPDGYHVKGASTLYKDGQPVMQWVKSNIDHERQAELMQMAMDALKEDVPREAPRHAYQEWRDALALAPRLCKWLGGK